MDMLHHSLKAKPEDSHLLLEKLKPWEILLGTFLFPLFLDVPSFGLGWCSSEMSLKSSMAHLSHCVCRSPSYLSFLPPLELAWCLRVGVTTLNPKLQGGPLNWADTHSLLISKLIRKASPFRVIILGVTVLGFKGKRLKKYRYQLNIFLSFGLLFETVFLYYRMVINP